jgi:metallo-beta-lactamase class B
MIQFDRFARRTCGAATLALACAATVPTASAQPFDGCPSAEILAAFEGFGQAGRMPIALGRWLNDAKAQYIEPFRAFDDVTFVGVCWVSAWVVRTSVGPVLIDTLHDPHVDQLLENLKRVGVDPASLRYVLMTHGHFDHVGGAARLKALAPNARFVMTRRGWDEGHASAQQSAGTPRAWKMVETDVVVRDGDTVTVGDTVFTVYETPGHTFGTASYEFPVRDGSTVHRAFTVGGLGLNAIQSSNQVEAFIDSVRRIEALVERRPDPVTVHLTTHPFSNGLIEASRRIAARPTGDAHPLVDPAGFSAQLRSLRIGAEERLEVERKAGR